MHFLHRSNRLRIEGEDVVDATTISGDSDWKLGISLLSISCLRRGGGEEEEEEDDDDDDIRGRPTATALLIFCFLRIDDDNVGLELEPALVVHRREDADAVLAGFLYCKKRRRKM